MPIVEGEHERSRLEKLNRWKALGVNPYAYGFERTHTTDEVKSNYEQLHNAGTQVRVAGRIVGLRFHGGSTFAHIQDREGKLQIYLKRDVLGENIYGRVKLLDIGDIIGVEGEVFTTKTGEITVLVRKFWLLTKSLHPLPEKWHGLRDIELRYRQRYIDLIVNPDVRRIFCTRMRIINEIRDFLNQRGYIEVETPILQPIYGGAFANPFATRYEALDQTVYLRISNELYLKRLIVGELEKVYEIGRMFRNEGMDRLHNPEFTSIEIYEAYTDYEGMMKLTEQLLTHVVQKVKGKLTLTYQGKEVDFTPPWARVTFFDALHQYTGKDFSKLTADEIISIGKELGIKVQPHWPPGKVLEKLLDKYVAPNLQNPTFIYDYPRDISPLAKSKRDGSNLVERFEIFIAGLEIGNAFSELNDPQEQYQRFMEQQSYQAEGQVMDEDFIHALKVGMPPTGGLGLGIDRIVMLLVDVPSIRDVMLFPHMRQ